ncbi:MULTISPECIES: ABC transporter ATP-binding protein [Pseudonocardia]|uniref:Spermidine/putrescine import ATP-binding protein PotA n=2 Tax=Pseudonocardia TaxID=1847 RepID=A0A1Y2MYW6_PSEAH|nr:MULTISPECIES: ABC transporter ATP-binding protein [Pseudonocardia]OSY40373.1 Spermidine/putrescine import ATP-binding protein PotA [Pseudonocardia autotrophica]TDN72296.1 iron(III) transport system ATP-binding protein [Pseudonocardia autotrophica]BBG03008.1 ABC transporter ATP-binding protein [Pseudonocardia autotrophica]GEC25090.1 ABC transporter ATP-binding protein [Pseudonocardia saturnea]
MSSVRISGLVKEFDGAKAVEHLDLDIAAGEFVTLLGPSGCGKTTTLRCLAGLEVPTRGEITIAGRAVYSEQESTFVPPDKRDIGMVFQSYGLWPHMTVGGNVGYPLKLAKVPRAQARTQVLEMLERVGLSDRADQMATSLSGGQQQRVALARAMVRRPTLMLFDEPLSNLDAKLRLSMRTQLRELHESMRTTSVYVTHDQEEAIALADRVVVMNKGLIEQVGSPRELYTRPVSAFVADFMGFQNILTGSVGDSVAGGYTVVVAGTTATVRVAGEPPGPPGTGVVVAFRAAHVRVERPGPDAARRLPGRVRSCTYLGSCLRVLVDLGGVPVRAQVDESDTGRFGPDDLAPGREVHLAVPPERVVPLPAETFGTGAGQYRPSQVIAG